MDSSANRDQGLKIRLELYLLRLDAKKKKKWALGCSGISLVVFVFGMSLCV